MGHTVPVTSSPVTPHLLQVQVMQVQVKPTVFNPIPWCTNTMVYHQYCSDILQVHTHTHIYYSQKNMKKTARGLKKPKTKPQGLGFGKLNMGGLALG